MLNLLLVYILGFIIMYIWVSVLDLALLATSEGTMHIPQSSSVIYAMRWPKITFRLLQVWLSIEF